MGRPFGASAQLECELGFSSRFSEFRRGSLSSAVFGFDAADELLVRNFSGPNPGEDGVLLMWTASDPLEKFFAEWASDPARGEWNTVPGTARDIGGVVLMTVPDLLERQFFRLRKMP